MRKKTSTKRGRKRRLSSKRVALLRALFGGALPFGLNYKQAMDLSDAVKEKRFDYDSLKKEVVIAVDPEIKGIGWKNYKPMRKVEPFGANQDMPKSYKELKDRMIIHKRRIFIDEVFAALELLIATTLFDCYDWGLKRIERVITLLREARSWDIGKFFCILQYLSDHKCMDFKNRDIKDLMACRRNMGGLMA